MKNLILMMMLLGMCCGLLAGCYDEGPGVAKSRFALMTTKEKLLYDKVESTWDSTRLLSLREAVGQREIKPSESFPPFVDVAGIVQSVNDIVLVTGSGWSEDQIKRYNTAKFDSLDKEWYDNIILNSSSPILKSIVNKEKEKAKLVVAERKAKEAAAAAAEKADAIEEKEMAELEVEKLKMQKQSTYTTMTSSVIVDAPVVNLSDLIPANDYSDLQFEIQNCEPAIDHLNKIITTYRRPVTISDREELIKLSLYCKTIELGELVNGD